MKKGQAGMALAVIFVAILVVDVPKDAAQGNILPDIKPFGMTAITVVMLIGGFLASKFRGDESTYEPRAFEIDIPEPNTNTQRKQVSNEEVSNEEVSNEEVSSEAVSDRELSREVSETG